MALLCSRVLGFSRNCLIKSSSLSCSYLISRNCTTKYFGDGLVKSEQVGKVQLIGINRPESRNCVNTQTAKALESAFIEFDKDEDSYVAVLHGIGGTFSSGFDLKEVASTTDADCGPDGKEFKMSMGVAHYECSKPVIGAIEGYAVAGGMELALWCDLRVMDENAIMGIFNRRFGVPLIDGGTARLPAIVGLGRALQLILVGREIKAKDALSWGLVTSVVPNSTAVDKAMELANSLTGFPQGCMRADRRSAINALFAPSLQDALKFEHEEGIKLITKESVGGAQRFVKGVGRHGKFSNDSSS